MGIGIGDRLGDGIGDGLGDGLGDSLGDGIGMGDGLGDGIGDGLGDGIGATGFARSGTWNSERLAPGRVIIDGTMLGTGLAGIAGVVTIGGLDSGLGLLVGLATGVGLILGVGVLLGLILGAIAGVALGRSGWVNSARVLLFISKARAGSTTPLKVRQVAKVKNLILNMVIFGISRIVGLIKNYNSIGGVLAIPSRKAINCPKISTT